MEDVDDEIPMIPTSNTKPQRMKKAARLFHENLTSGPGANIDQVNATYREPEHRQLSMTLTILTLVVLVSTLVFLVLFLILPLFYNLNHPLHLEAGEPHVERGHSHSADGAAGEHAGHDGMKEDEESADSTDAAEKMASMENQKMNSEWIQRISEICQCFAKLVENGKSQSAMKITTEAVEICLRSCFSSASTTEDPRSPTPGPSVLMPVPTAAVVTDSSRP